MRQYRLTVKYSVIVAFVLSSVPLSSGQISCEPCGNGEIPSDEGSCPDLSLKASGVTARTPMCAEIQLEMFQEGCCKQPPRDRCTLCPDGRPFVGSSVVPNFRPSDEDLSCADLNADVAYLDYLFESGTCDDTLLRRSASWCGCPGVEQTCSLCPNGERPPNPGLVDRVYYGWDCDTFDFVSSYFSEGECNGLVDSIFEFDAPSFCGCSNAPIPAVCDLCPPGQMIANPDLLLGHNDRFSCRELALSTRFIPAEGACERAISSHTSNGYVFACCAPIGNVPKIYGGTAAAYSNVVQSLWLTPTSLLLLSISMLWS
jgi:hypothetical protein